MMSILSLYFILEHVCQLSSLKYNRLYVQSKTKSVACIYHSSDCFIYYKYIFISLFTWTSISFKVDSCLGAKITWKRRFERKTNLILYTCQNVYLLQLHKLKNTTLHPKNGIGRWLQKWLNRKVLGRQIQFILLSA